MAGIRELLAIALGVLLGLVAITFPDTLVRIQTAGTRPDRQDGYGDDSGTVSTLARRVVQFLGVVALAVAVVIAYQTF